jgi:hypothetical protein
MNGGFKMGECKVDHPLVDVKTKYESQVSFLPSELLPLFQQFFDQEHTQEILNEVFHLLKKYDLCSEAEQEHRNNRLYMVLKSLSPKSTGTNIFTGTL